MTSKQKPDAGETPEPVQEGAVAVRRPKHAGGRPTKLTPEIKKKVCSAVRNGSFIETAAAFVGVNKDSLHEWMRRGAREKSGIYHEFSVAIGQAFAEAEVSMVNALVAAAKGDPGHPGDPERGIAKRPRVPPDPRALAFWLERARQTTWGKRQRVALEGVPERDGGEPIRTEGALHIYLPAEEED
jgi:hypothetical protein